MEKKSLFHWKEILKAHISKEQEIWDDWSFHSNLKTEFSKYLAIFTFSESAGLKNFCVSKKKLIRDNLCFLFGKCPGTGCCDANDCPLEVSHAVEFWQDTEGITQKEVSWDGMKA